MKTDGLYITSDPHFGERVHIGGFSSAEERDEHIIKRWNETVEPGARVLVLGDVGSGRRTSNSWGDCTDRSGSCLATMTPVTWRSTRSSL